jgi:hypothetical protein
LHRFHGLGEEMGWVCLESALWSGDVCGVHIVVLAKRVSHLDSPCSIAQVSMLSFVARDTAKLRHGAKLSIPTKPSLQRICEICAICGLSLLTTGVARLITRVSAMKSWSARRWGSNPTMMYPIYIVRSLSIFPKKRMAARP